MTSAPPSEPDASRPAAMIIFSLFCGAAGKQNEVIRQKVCRLLDAETFSPLE